MRRSNSTWAIIAGFALSITIALFLLRNNYFKYYSESFDVNKETPEISFLNGANISDKPICTTTACKESASVLMTKIDFNVDPCNNFYEFACGSFIKNSEIPEDKSHIDVLELLTDEVKDQIMEIISEPIQPEDIPPFVLTKQLYKACMNESIIEQRGLTPVTNILNKLGGWPVLEKDKWNETEFIWYKTLIEVSKLGLEPHVIIYVVFTNDAKNNTNYVLNINEGELSLDREYFIQGLENDVVKAYFDYMVNVAVAMGANEMDAKQELKESLLFEMKLANFTLSNKERENGTNLYNPTSIKELQKIHPTIPLLNYVNSMLHSITNITEDEIVINSVPQYIKEVEKLLQETPKRTIANYIIWRTIKQIIIHLPPDYRKFSHDFSSVMSGVTAQLGREKQCFDIINENLGITVGALYARNFFRRDSKREAVDLVQNIQLEFKNMLETIDWMDDKTKQNALKKIDALYAHVAYPEELMDDNKLIDYYNNLIIDENMYLESVLNISLFIEIKELKQLRQPINKTHWTRHSDTTDVNAFYAPDNSIEFPAGILQGEFFSNDRPKYMNYGGIGYIIGHEITHGFDDFGRQYDKDGNLVDWWEPATNEAFVKKAQCIINQCGNYSIGNLTLNGVNTLGENIADNGGAKYAYRAYKRWVKAHDPEPSLPGLSFTPEQMFWISMATSWCSKYRPAYLKDLVMTDEHSPIEFRMNGVVSNQEEFANDFGCVKGSPMNPDVKCKVW